MSRTVYTTLWKRLGLDVREELPIEEHEALLAANPDWEDRLKKAENPSPPPVELTFEELKTLKKAEISAAWIHDIEVVGMPLAGYMFSVDYGIEDALIWENAIDYIAPEATEVEVRAVDDSFHVIPRTLFEQVPAMQKAYYAQQLQRKWVLQKDADAAASKEALAAIAW